MLENQVTRWAGKEKEMHDGCGLCSPGRWHPDGPVYGAYSEFPFSREIDEPGPRHLVPCSKILLDQFREEEKPGMMIFQYSPLASIRPGPQLVL